MDLASRTVEYRDLEGFPEYRIGSNGDVLSCWAQVGSLKWTISDKWRKLKPGIDSDGYSLVTLCNKTGERRQFKVHHLVLEAFGFPKPTEYKAECRHLDDDKTNNWIWNLCWGTSKENKDDSLRNGSRLFGEKHPAHKLSDDEASQVFSLAASRKNKEAGSLTYGQIADRFRISKQHVWQIANRKRRSLCR